MKTIKSDVLIIGAGIAGLVAAYECLEKGLTVSLVDRDIEANSGGLAKLAFGGMALVDTPLQRRMGIKDSPQLALKDWHSFAQFGENDHLPRVWAEYYVNNCTEKVYEWLRALGLNFFPAVNWVERGLQGDGNSVPRYHVIWGTGYGLVELMLKKISVHTNAANLKEFYEHKVNDLSLHEDIVVGCEAICVSDQSKVCFQADNTIVATGGINGSIDKVKTHWYKPWGLPPQEILNGSHPFADGQLHEAIEKVGGNVTHLDKMWNYAAGIPHPNPKFDGHGLSLIPCKSALWLDAKGKRIGPEPLTTGYDTNELCRRVSQLDESHTWQVLNWRIAAKELAISGSEHNPSIRDKKLLNFLKEVLFGNHQLVKNIAAESDHVVVADDLDSLVVKMQSIDDQKVLERDKVVEAVREFDSMILRGPSQWNDDQIRRIQHARAWRSDKLRTCKPKPIQEKSSGPLIAIKLRLISRKSLGGIQTNLKSEVVDSRGKSMPGLYAVGEAAGFGGGGANGFKSLEGTFLSGCILTARSAVEAISN